LAHARTSVVLAASRAELWAVVGDPRQLPRWWPGVARVEAVSDVGFTEVMPTRSGRGIRLDFRCVAEPPQTFTWDLELAGTPFARVLTRWVTTVRLSELPEGGTRIEIEELQELRGRLRLGALLQWRAARRRLAAAAGGLRALSASPGTDRRG
jgi:uncharacterized protein YndB with AHSA1/START domain